MRTVKEIVLALDEKGWYVPAPVDESTPDGFVVQAARITQGVICHSVVRSKEEITEEVWERLTQEAYAKAFPYLAENDWQRLFSIPTPMPQPKPQAPPPPSPVQAPPRETPPSRPVNRAPEVEIEVKAEVTPAATAAQVTPPVEGGAYDDLPPLSDSAKAVVAKIKNTVTERCDGDASLAGQYIQAKYVEHGFELGVPNSVRKFTTDDFKAIHSWALKFDLENERGKVAGMSKKSAVPDFDPNARRVIKSKGDHPFEDELVQLYSDAAENEAAEDAFSTIFAEEGWDIMVGKDEVKAEKVLARMQSYLANAQLQQTLGMNPAVN